MSPLGGSGRHTSVAIAGGGLIGLSIAWHLARQGVHVTVFEKAELGTEASWAGAGMLAPGGEVEELSSLSRLAIESRQLYPEFIRELEREAGMAIDYQECGALELTYSPESWRVLESRAARQREIGIRNRPVSMSTVPKFWPRVRVEGLTGAFFYPDDAIVNPREFVTALAAACRKLGVKIFQNCAVKVVSVTSSEALVDSDRNLEAFDASVVAAGAWSGAIAVQGVPALPDTYPVKGHLVGYHQPEQTCSTILRHGRLYMLQRATGLLIAGASVEHIGFVREVDQAIAASLAHEASWLMPHLTETTPTEVWTGFRPGSDTLQLGRWHSNRLFLAYGHYRNGILLAPVTGKHLSHEIIASLGTR